MTPIVEITTDAAAVGKYVAAHIDRTLARRLARARTWYPRRPRHVSCHDLGVHLAVEPRTTKSGL